MSVVAITRGGAGDCWRFATARAALDHPLVQFGDPVLRQACDLTKTLSQDEMVDIARRLGDERHSLSLRRLVDESSVAKLWRLMVEESSTPPTDPRDICSRVVADRIWTRENGVHVHSSHDNRSISMAKEPKKRTPQVEGEAGAGEKPTRPVSRVGRFEPTSVLTLGTDKAGNKYGPKNNPKRKGSAAHDRFARYVDGMTLQTALDAGVTRPDLNWDLKMGFISLA